VGRRCRVCRTQSSVVADHHREGRAGRAAELPCARALSGPPALRPLSEFAGTASAWPGPVVQARVEVFIIER
jgi:hypothetical protein